MGADGLSTEGRYEVTSALQEGILPVSLTGYPAPIEPLVVETAKQVPEFGPYNLNMNSGDPIGMGE